MVQYFFGKAQGVSSPSVSGRAVACRRLLLCPVFIPNWYLVGTIILVTIIPCRGVSFRSIDGPGYTGFLIQVFAQIVRGVGSRFVAVMKRYVWPPGRVILWWNGLVVEF